MPRFPATLARLLLIALWPPLAAAQAEGVVAGSLVLPGEHGSLHAVDFRPADTADGLQPAVVALHGCSGLYAGKRLNARFQAWGEQLAQAGFRVVFPDSFGSRGLGSQCRNSHRAARASRERVGDAYQAKAFLQQQPGIDPDRIYLMGWSNGAATVLHTVQPQRAARDAGPDFAKAVAFYPGCRVPYRRATRYARLPTLILIGEQDNWTPAAPCRQLAEAARAQGEPVDLVVYPGAHHDFDHPSLPLRKRTGLAYTADGSGTAYVGSDPAALADARQRIPVYFGAAAPAATPLPSQQ